MMLVEKKFAGLRIAREASMVWKKNLSCLTIAKTFDVVKRNPDTSFFWNLL